jgi:hypothetical protein
MEIFCGLLAMMFGKVVEGRANLLFFCELMQFL